MKSEELQALCDGYTYAALKSVYTDLLNARSSNILEEEVFMLQIITLNLIYMKLGLAKYAEEMPPFTPIMYEPEAKKVNAAINQNKSSNNSNVVNLQDFRKKDD